jgi:hypothetical protein
MRLVLLAALAFLPHAASAAEAPPSPVPASAVVSGDVDQRTLELLRAIRAEAASSAPDTATLRDQLEALRGDAVDPAAQDRVARATDYLQRIESGQTLPPPSPDELVGSDGSGDADEERAVTARVKEAGAGRTAAQKTADLLEQVSAATTGSGPAAAGSFDGKVRRPAQPVEVEPAPGYHTVAADDFLTQADDAGRLGVMTAAATDLLAKAGRKNKDGMHAADIAGAVTALLEQNPLTARMSALRLRVRPDGEILILYRLNDGVVAELDTGMSLDSTSTASKKKLRGGRRKRKKKNSGGGDDGDQGGGDDGDKSAGGGTGGKGGGGSDGGGDAVASGGRARGDGGDGGSVDGSDAGDGSVAAAADAPAGGGRGPLVDPDGGAASARRGRGGAPSGPAASAPAVDLPAGFTPAAGPGDESATASADGSAARPASAARRGSAEAGIPDLPRLTGDLAGGRAAFAAAAGTSSPAAPSAPPAARAAVSVAAAAPVPPRAANAAPVYGASSDGPLRDAVAASPVAAPAPASKAAAVVAAADRAASRSSAVPAALLLGSAALGALGYFLRRPQA